MSDILSIVAITISIAGFIIVLLQYKNETRSKIKCSLETVSGYVEKSGNFVPYTKRYLFISNLSKRETAILDVSEYRPGKSYSSIIKDQIIEIGGWKIIKIDLNTKEDEQYPIAILIQDMDDKKLYGISYINPYNEEEMLPRQKRFRDIAEFEKYYSKMQEKLEIENYKKRKIYPIPRAKKISKRKQYNYLKNIAGNIDKEINKTNYYKKGES